MGKQQHIVQKLTVEIGLRSRDIAFEIQTKISNEYKRLVLNSMNEVFDRLVGEDEFLSIDKLEIDLGKIKSTQLEFEIPEKVKKEIEEALVKLLFEARNTPGGNAEVRIVTAKGSTITVQANVKNGPATLFDTLIYYLEYGLLPWTSDRTEKPTLRFLLGEAMTHHPEMLRGRLKQFNSRQYVFRRLALQLEEDQLQYLAAIAGCGFSSSLTAHFKKIKFLIENVFKSNENSPGKMPTENALKFFLWRETLSYFSGTTENNSETEINFLAAILKRLFSEFEIQIPFLKNVKNDFEDVFKKAVKQVQEEFTATAKQKAIVAEEAQELKTPQTKAIEKEIKKILAPAVKMVLPETPELEEGIYIENAGMVILGPYLPGFFRKIGFVEGKEFVNEEARWKAVHLLQWMVDGGKEKDGEKIKENVSEHELVLNKIFCGIDIAEPIPLNIELSENEKAEAIDLLQSVIDNWEIIKRSSIMGLQLTFLQKEGKLKRMNDEWELNINRDSAVDILIDRLPWSISMIRLPWNKETVHVVW